MTTKNDRLDGIIEHWDEWGDISVDDYQWLIAKVKSLRGQLVEVKELLANHYEEDEDEDNRGN